MRLIIKLALPPDPAERTALVSTALMRVAGQLLAMSLDSAGFYLIQGLDGATVGSIQLQEDAS
jgi:hypothetical protein